MPRSHSTHRGLLQPLLAPLQAQQSLRRAASLGLQAEEAGVFSNVVAGCQAADRSAMLLGQPNCHMPQKNCWSALLHVQDTVLWTRPCWAPA